MVQTLRAGHHADEAVQPPSRWRLIRCAVGRLYRSYYNVANWVDITARKQVEKRVHDNEGFINDVFNSIQHGIGVLDRDLSIGRANRWMEEMYAEQIPLTGKMLPGITEKGFYMPLAPI